MKVFLFLLLTLTLTFGAQAQSASSTPAEAVTVTRDAAEVKGLTKLGEVEGRSLFFGLTAKKGEKDATRKIQEAAARLGATKVLIVHQDGMGSTTLKGIAYRASGGARKTAGSAPGTAAKSPGGSTPEGVTVTRDPNEVAGLKKVGEVEGRSPFFGLTAKKGEKDATKQLCESAAKLGARKVLIVHQDGMGSTVLKGLAYR